MVQFLYILFFQMSNLHFPPHLVAVLEVAYNGSQCHQCYNSIEHPRIPPHIPGEKDNKPQHCLRLAPQSVDIGSFQTEQVCSWWQVAVYGLTLAGISKVPVSIISIKLI